MLLALPNVVLLAPPYKMVQALPYVVLLALQK